MSIRTLLPIAAFIVAAITLSGCYPQKVSPECIARMNGCIRKCTPGDSSKTSPADQGTRIPVDARTECERSCHELCTWGKGSHVDSNNLPDPDKVMGNPQTNQ
jgi:hypothetical protein